ncbi:MAG: nucleotidyltransferase family protein [Bacillota bacterium]
MLSKQQIIKLIGEHQSTLRQYGVHRIALFGSLLHGTATETSDIDLLVEFKEKSFDNYMGLKYFLEDLLGQQVDLVLPETLKPRLKPIVMREVEYVAEI